MADKQADHEKDTISLLDLFEVRHTARRWLRENRQAFKEADVQTIRTMILKAPAELTRGGKARIATLHQYLSSKLGPRKL